MPFKRSCAFDTALPSPPSKASTAAGREPSPGTRSMRSGRGQPYLTTNAASSSSVTSGEMLPIQRFMPSPCASAHDIQAAVDVERAAGDAARIGRREVGNGVADVGDVDQLAQRRALRSLVQQQVEILETGGGAGLERPGRYRVHPNVLGAELVRKI